MSKTLYRAFASTFLAFAFAWCRTPAAAMDRDTERALHEQVRALRNLKNKEGKTNREIRDAIWRLADAGLMAVEVDGWRNTYDDETGIYQTYLFAAMVDEYNAAHPAQKLIKTNGSDDHNQPGEGIEMGRGRNGNLLAEFGRYEIVQELRAAQKRLMSRPSAHAPSGTERRGSTGCSS